MRIVTKTAIPPPCAFKQLSCKNPLSLCSRMCVKKVLGRTSWWIRDITVSSGLFQSLLIKKNAQNR